jgi:hypothetical protein
VRWLSLLLVAACSFDKGTALGTAPGDGKLSDTPSDGSGGVIDALGWAYKRILTIDNTGLAALADYPLLVELDSARIRYSTDGADLRFTTTGGTALDYEIESWNPSGRSFVWVRVPTIPAGTTTAIVMLYGNPAAVDAQQPAMVWDNNYIGVWHLADAHDSTGRNTSTNHSATTTSGQIGTAMAFASGHYIDTGSHDHPTQWTLEAWIDPNAASMSGVSNGSSIVARFPNYLLLWDCSNSVFCTSTLYNGSSTTTTYKAVYTGSAGQWSYIAGTYDGQKLTAYTGGAQTDQQSTTDTPIDTTPTSLDATIGIRQDLLGPYTGGIDEVRISKVSRSADYLQANAKAVAGTYISFGAEQAN